MSLPFILLWLVLMAVAVTSVFACRNQVRAARKSSLVPPGVLPPGSSMCRVCGQEMGRDIATDDRAVRAGEGG